MVGSKLPIRLLVETLAIIASVEMLIMILLPVVAPHADDLIAGALDTVVLTTLTCPLVLWRTRRAHARGSSSEPILLRSRGAGSPALVFLILIVGVAASLSSAAYLQHSTHGEAAARFERLSERVGVEVIRRFQVYEDGLRGARGVFVAAPNATREDFRAYMASRDMDREFPGALGFGFVSRVSRGSLPAFIDRQRADGTPDFTVRTSGDHDELFIVRQIEPLSRNLPALGYDIGSEPARRAAAERAMFTGEPALTSRITLVQDERQRHGFLFLLPVFPGGTDPGTVDARHQSLGGWVFAPLVIDDVLANVSDVADRKIDLEIFGAPSLTADNAIFDTDGTLAGAVDESCGVAPEPRMFRMSKAISVGGQRWTLHFSSTPAFESDVDRTSPALAGIIGVMLSALLAAVVWSLGHSRARAISLATSMTDDLRASEHQATRARLDAERALADLAAYKLILDEHAIVTMTDTRGVITDANDRFCAISKYSREQLIGSDHRLINSGHHPKAFWTDMWRTIAHGGIWHGEVCNRARDGSLYWVNATIGPIRDRSGKILQYVAIRTDISALKAAQAEMQHARNAAEAANRTKSEFLANMSHEIRTPLTAILGYADLLREDGDLSQVPERRLQTIETIRSAGQHLLTIINDILDLSKIEAGRMAVERIETPVPAILCEIDSLMRVRTASKGITLAVRLGCPLPEKIWSDPTRLRQILMNLVGNAVKFTQRGGVTVTARSLAAASGTLLIVEVEDTGDGMTPEQAASLFQPFTQADATVTRRHGGTGLGLTICRRLSHLMGGQVTLVRTAPGEGSCFRLDLPLEPVAGSSMVSSLIGAATPDRDSGAAPMPSLRGRILLAEDGLDNQRLISFHLTKAGASVEVAPDGRVALEMIERNAQEGRSYDLLVTDMQMPEMDGYTLCRTLRQRGYTVAIVALTAHAMAEDRRRCEDAGCDDYAVKPIDKAHLIATCAAWLGRASLRASRHAA